MILDKHITKTEFPDIVEEGYCNWADDRKDGVLVDIVANPTVYMYQRGIQIKVPIFI